MICVYGVCGYDVQCACMYTKIYTEGVHSVYAEAAIKYAVSALLNS